MLIPKNPKKHIYIPLPDEDWKALKIKAIKAGMSLEKLVAKILKQFISHT